MARGASSRSRQSIQQQASIDAVMDGSASRSEVLPKDTQSWLMESMKLQNILNSHLVAQSDANQEFILRIGEQIMNVGNKLNQLVGYETPQDVSNDQLKENRAELKMDDKAVPGIHGLVIEVAGQNKNNEPGT